MDSAASMASSGQSSTNQFHCHDCGMELSAQRAYVRHLKTLRHLEKTGRTLEQKFECPGCNHGFTRKEDRERHRDKRQCPGIDRSGSTSSPQLPRQYGNAEDHPFASGSAGDATITAIHGAADDVASFQSTVNSRSQPPSSDGTELLPERLWSVTTSSLTDSGVVMTFESPSGKSSKIFDADWNEIDKELLDASVRSIRKASSLSHRSILKRNGRIFAFPPTSVQMCASCKTVLEEGQRHARAPKRNRTGDFPSRPCDVCCIGFIYEQDLIMHQKHSAQGHCGFLFTHKELCQGHHPPELPDHWETMSDNDDFRMQRSLYRWEEAQLRADAAEHLTIKSVCMCMDTLSIDVFDQESEGSNEHSVQTVATAPGDKGKSGSRDIHGLQQQLKEWQHRQVSRMDLWMEEDGDSFHAWLYCGGDR